MILLLIPFYSFEGPAMSQNVKRSADTLLYVCRFIGGSEPFKAGRPAWLQHVFSWLFLLPSGAAPLGVRPPALGAEYDDVRAPRVLDVFVHRL